MGCKVCEVAAIGYNYSIDGTCHTCGRKHHSIGEYKGMDGADHYFRLHPTFMCTGCGEIREYALVPCNDVVDITEEYKIMEHRKDSHWVGR